MNEKGTQYAIATLKERRATMAGEIIQFAFPLCPARA